MAVVPDENIDARPSDTSETELGASGPCDEGNSTDEFSKQPIEDTEAQLVELLQNHLSKRCRKLGLCANCGHDLRGSEARCPECGSAFGVDPPKSQGR